MVLRKVDELETEPAIGKRYLVPCVKRNAPYVHKGSLWVPVIGPLHEDAEFIRFPSGAYNRSPKRQSSLRINVPSSASVALPSCQVVCTTFTAG